eukprot:TRINITY_DN19343_c0_g1_i1.p1 TRINITY_DN19343_c0_g1~~TRINITY_DN19343_c0_g1_i1.p1  ORF type:complete len:909 (+),score=194.08 TRINITY_DN19343_c0_g1_i1:134-2860(+)
MADPPCVDTWSGGGASGRTLHSASMQASASRGLKARQERERPAWQDSTVVTRGASSGLTSSGSCLRRDSALHSAATLGGGSSASNAAVAGRPRTSRTPTKAGGVSTVAGRSGDRTPPRSLSARELRLENDASSLAAGPSVFESSSSRPLLGASRTPPPSLRYNSRSSAAAVAPERPKVRAASLRQYQRSSQAEACGKGDCTPRRVAPGSELTPPPAHSAAPAGSVAEGAGKRAPQQAPRGGAGDTSSSGSVPLGAAVAAPSMQGSGRPASLRAADGASNTPRRKAAVPFGTATGSTTLPLRRHSSAGTATAPHPAAASTLSASAALPAARQASERPRSTTPPRHSVGATGASAQAAAAAARGSSGRSLTPPPSAQRSHAGHIESRRSVTPPRHQAAMQQRQQQQQADLPSSQKTGGASAQSAPRRHSGSMPAYAVAALTSASHGGSSASAASGTSGTKAGVRARTPPGRPDAREEKASAAASAGGGGGWTPPSRRASLESSPGGGEALSARRLSKQRERAVDQGFQLNGGATPAGAHFEAMCVGQPQTKDWTYDVQRRSLAAAEDLFRTARRAHDMVSSGGGSDASTTDTLANGRDCVDAGRGAGGANFQGQQGSADEAGPARKQPADNSSRSGGGGGPKVPDWRFDFESLAARFAPPKAASVPSLPPSVPSSPGGDSCCLADASAQGSPTLEAVDLQLQSPASHVELPSSTVVVDGGRLSHSGSPTDERIGSSDLLLRASGGSRCQVFDVASSPGAEGSPFPTSFGDSSEDDIQALSEVAAAGAAARQQGGPAPTAQSIAPLLRRLLKENAELRNAFGTARQRITALEDEQSRFLEEGVFDFVNAVHGHEQPRGDVNRGVAHFAGHGKALPKGSGDFVLAGAGGGYSPEGELAAVSTLLGGSASTGR